MKEKSAAEHIRTEIQVIPGTDVVTAGESPGYERLLIESAGDGICGLDLAGDIVYLNPAARRMLGMDDSALGTSMHATVHHARAEDGGPYTEEECPICLSFRSEEGCRVDHEVFWRPDRNSFPVEYSAFPILNGAERVGTVVSFSDISTRAIRALAAIHDLLTQEAKAGGHADSVSARAAIERLMPLVRGMVGDTPLECHVEDVRLALRNGTSLAVLVNELVSNAVKHGEGPISISLTAQNGSARLRVSDSGRGFPSDFDPSTAAHTGLELIESLARWDLRGNIAYANRSEGGAQITITFPVDD